MTEEDAHTQHYRWFETDALGLPQHGVLVATSIDHAEIELQAIGIKAEAIRPATKNTGSAVGLIQSLADACQLPLEQTQLQGLSARDLTLFSRQLSGLLGAGIPLNDALETLEQSSKPTLRRVIQALQQSLQGGLNFGDAVAAHPHIFDSCYVSLIRAGEATGGFASALNVLAANYERSAQLRRRIRQALFQPALILCTALGAAWILLAFVMPEFASMYQQQQQTLPELTRWVITLSEQLHAASDRLLSGVAVCCALGALAYHRSTPVRMLVHRSLLTLPLLGPLIRYANAGQMCRTLAASISAGIPVLEALPFAADACRNDAYRRSIAGLAAQLRNGNSLANAMQADPCFPHTLPKIIRLGEQSGKLGDMLEQANTLYDTSLEQGIERLLPLLEPVLMLLLGVLVGGLILAMYLPIFSMGDLFLG